MPVSGNRTRLNPEAIELGNAVTHHYSLLVDYPPNTSDVFRLPISAAADLGRFSSARFPGWQLLDRCMFALVLKHERFVSRSKNQMVLSFFL